MTIYWFDVVFLMVVSYHSYKGYHRHFITGCFEFAGLAAVFLSALAGYPYLSPFLKLYKGGVGLISDLLSFLILIFIGQLLYQLFFPLVSGRVDRFVHRTRFKGVDRRAGILPGFATGLLLSAIFVAVIQSLPYAYETKNEVTASFFGGFLSRSVAEAAPSVEKALGRPEDDLLAFTADGPFSKATEMPRVGSFKVDRISEMRMLEMVNDARSDAGVAPLKYSARLTKAARAHSLEMWKKRYFEHRSPVKGEPQDRMAEAGAVFSLSGENIAMAPDVGIAHGGLMKSEGHRRNILDPSFRQVGIGCIKTPGYGLMFTQDFTD